MNQFVDGEELDRIGLIGQAHFKKICFQAKFKGGEIEPDRTGKDFLIESRLESTDTIVPLDKRPSPLKVAAQVKTLMPKSNSARVALSVAERLAKDPGPAVICVFRLDEHEEPREMTFIHLLGGHLERVLKALRRASGNAARLHKKTLTFAIPEKNWVPATPLDFFAEVMALVPAGMHAYVIEKRRQLDMSGYSGDRYTMSFSPMNMSPSEIADAFLGVTTLPVARVALKEKRFDITLPLGVSFERATFDIEAVHDKSGILRLTSGGTPHIFSSKCRFMTIGPDVHGGDSVAFSFQTDAGRLVINHGTLRYFSGAGFSESSRHTLAAWRDFMMMQRVIQTDNFEFSLECEGLDEPWRFPVESDTFNDPAPQWYLDFFEIVEVVFAESGLEGIRFSLDDLRRYGHAVNEVGRIVSSSNARFVAEVTSGSPTAVDVAGAYVSAVELFGRWIGVFIPMTASSQDHEDSTTFSGEQSGRVLLERLNGADLDQSFERFRTKLTSLSGARAIMIQSPGDFMQEQGSLLELGDDDLP